MDPLKLIAAPAQDGWAVYLTDGREVARFRGPFAGQRAMRYLAKLSAARDPNGRLDGGHVRAGADAMRSLQRSGDRRRRRAVLRGEHPARRR
jgi:hypothetical protein